MSSKDMNTKENSATFQVAGKVDIDRLRNLLQQDAALTLQVMAARQHSELSLGRVDTRKGDDE